MEDGEDKKIRKIFLKFAKKGGISKFSSNKHYLGITKLGIYNKK